MVRGRGHGHRRTSPPIRSATAAAPSRSVRPSPTDGSWPSDGALIVDVGGESTRPGAEPVGIDDGDRPSAPGDRHARRRRCAGRASTPGGPRSPAPAIAAGAHVVNDVSGLADPEMVTVCRDDRDALVIGHMQGIAGDDAARPDLRRRRRRGHRRAARPAPTGPSPQASRRCSSTPASGSARPPSTTWRCCGRCRSTSPTRSSSVRRARASSVASRGAAAPADRDAGTLAAHLVAAQRGTALVRAHDVAAHVQALAVLAVL